jgi:hypothetical protein
MNNRIFIAIALFIVFAQGVNGQFIQQGKKLVNTNAAEGGMQGYSVDISANGNTAIVGVPLDGTTGGAFIYTRSNGVWKQDGQKIYGNDYEIGSFVGLSQGAAVAISGDGSTVAIGDPNDNDFLGAVYVFKRINGVWKQQGEKLVASGITGVAGQGYSVDLSYDGSTLVFGAPYIYVGNSPDKGGAFVFSLVGTEWLQESNNLFSGTTASRPQEGYSVAISGNGSAIVVGAPGRPGSTGDGDIHFYALSGGIWGKKNSIPGASNMGVSVSLNHDGTRAAIGVPGALYDVGGVEIYTLRGIWEYSITLRAANVKEKFNQGESVSISADGNRVAIGGGANYRIRATGLGQAWVFTKSGNSWIEDGQKYQGNGAVGNARQGISIALSADGNSFILGGSADDNNKGAAWVFALQSSTTSVFTDNNEDNSIAVFPNPVSTQLNIRVNTPGAFLSSITITDQLGKIAVSFMSENDEVFYSHNIEDLAEGLYYINCTNSLGYETRTKFLKINKGIK